MRRSRLRWWPRRRNRSTRSSDPDRRQIGSNMATTTTIAAVKAVKAPTQTGDIVARWVVLVFAASLLAIAALLVYELLIGSAEARSKLGLWGFLFSSKWNPVTD